MEDDTMDTDKPVKVLRDGAVAASIWLRRTSAGVFYDVTFSRCWKDEETGRWGYSQSFSDYHLDPLAELAQEAAVWRPTGCPLIRRAGDVAATDSPRRARPAAPRTRRCRRHTFGLGHRAVIDMALPTPITSHSGCCNPGSTTMDVPMGLPTPAPTSSLGRRPRVWPAYGGASDLVVLHKFLEKPG